MGDATSAITKIRSRAQRVVEGRPLRLVSEGKALRRVTEGQPAPPVAYDPLGDCPDMDLGAPDPHAAMPYQVHDRTFRSRWH